MNPLNISNTSEQLNFSQSVGKALKSIELFHEKIQKANTLPLQDKQKSLSDINAKVLDAQKFIDGLQEPTIIENRYKELNDEITQLKAELRQIDYSSIGRFFVSTIYQIPDQEVAEKLRVQIKSKEEELFFKPDYGSFQKMIENALEEIRVCLDEIDHDIESSFLIMDSSPICEGLTKDEKIQIILKGKKGALPEVLNYANQYKSNKALIIISQLSATFLTKLMKSENDKIIPLLMKFPQKEDYSRSFIREHPEELEMINSMKFSNFEFMEALSKISEDEYIEDFLEEIVEIKNGMILIDCFVEIPKKDRRELIEMAQEALTFKNKPDELRAEIEILAPLSDHERENYVSSLKYSAQIDPLMNPEVTLGVNQVPIHERAELDSFPDFSLLKPLSGHVNPVFLFYLLPKEARNQLPQAKGLIIEEYKRALLNSCFEKFANFENLPESTLSALSQFVLDNSKALGVGSNDILYETAEYYRKLLASEKSPFALINLTPSKDSSKRVQRWLSTGKRLIDSRMSDAEKVKVMWGIIALNVKEDSNVIKFLAEVPFANRADATMTMSNCKGLIKQLLSEELHLSLGMIQKLAVLSQSKNFTTLKNWIFEDYHLVKTMTELPQDQMMDVLKFMMQFPLENHNLSPFLTRVIKIPHQERFQILEFAKEIATAKKFNVSIKDVLESMDDLLKLPDLEARAEYVDACKYGYGVIEAQGLKRTTDVGSIITGFLQIPKSLRKKVYDSLPSYLDLKGLADDKNPIFVFYLLPGYVLKEVYPTLTPADLNEMLLKSGLNILNNMEEYPEKTVVGALDVLDKLEIEDERNIDYIDYVRSTLSGQQNPYKVVKKLKDLLNEPLSFQPASTRINHQYFAYDMKKLKKISNETVVNRGDLPKDVTLEAFNELFFSFLEINSSIMHEKIGELLSPPSGNLSAQQEGSNIWDSIDLAITKDPQNRLTKLLKETGDVREIEAKWKMVLKHILSKKNEKEQGHFFTERQESFLKIMSGIVSCETGKEQGIHATYSFLPPEERGKTQFSTEFKSVGELEEEKVRKEVITFLTEKVLTDSEDQVSSLLNYATNDTKESAGKLMQILPYDEKFYDSEDQIIFVLNDEGANEILKILGKEQVKDKVLPFLNHSIQFFMDKQMTGVSNAIIEDLTKTENVAEPPHQKKYLRNLIGSLVGLKEEINFDKHSGVIHGRLFRLSREEVLEIFFRHATIRRLIKTLAGDINEDIEKNQTEDMFFAFLPDENYWEGNKMTEEGALQLLLQTALKKA